MVFIFGGAHQGMEDYALKECAVENVSVLDEARDSIDFSQKAIGGLEMFVLGCVKRGESAVDYFKAHRQQWQNSVLIGMDFSCGLVPMDAQTRFWREENGRLNNYLAGEADRVVRMFCGLPQVIK